MPDRLALIFDCGATNVRVVAINTTGEIVAKQAVANETSADPHFKSGIIWDADAIWKKFVHCAQSVASQINTANISSITVTTFGVNGAPTDKSGNLLYPVISWQCQRTVPVMESIAKYIKPEDLYAQSGVNQFSFNTINVLIWLMENKPEVIDKMEGFLFMPSIFINKMTGNPVNDSTMLGTGMLSDIKKRSVSDLILEKTKLPNRFFEVKDPGTIAGELTPDMAKELNLPAGIPVVLTGHDTQFALIGAGAEENEVVLSSGTWEILMSRSSNVDLSSKPFAAGITNELDAMPGIYNSGIQWLASGIVEWIKTQFYGAEIAQHKNVYDIMDAEAMKAANTKVKLDPDFINKNGVLSGLGIKTKRGEIYYAALDALSEQLKKSLDILQDSGKFKAESLIAVGGGTKNAVWNQLRANKLGIPLRIAQQTETTVLGASVFAHTAVGNFASLQEGIDNMCKNYKYITPE